MAVACSYNGEKKNISLNYENQFKEPWKILTVTVCQSYTIAYELQLWAGTIFITHLCDAFKDTLTSKKLIASFRKALQSEGMLLVNDDTVKAMVWIYIYKLV